MTSVPLRRLLNENVYHEWNYVTFFNTSGPGPKTENTCLVFVIQIYDTN